MTNEVLIKELNGTFEKQGTRGPICAQMYPVDGVRMINSDLIVREVDCFGSLFPELESDDCHEIDFVRREEGDLTFLGMFFVQEDEVSDFNALGVFDKSGRDVWPELAKKIEALSEKEEIPYLTEMGELTMDSLCYLHSMPQLEDINYFEQMKALNEEEQALLNMDVCPKEEWDDFCRRKSELVVSFIENWKNVEITDARENDEQNKDIAYLKKAIYDYDALTQNEKTKCGEPLSFHPEGTLRNEAFDVIGIKINQNPEQYFQFEIREDLENLCEKEDLREFLLWTNGADYDSISILSNLGDKEETITNIMNFYAMGNIPHYSEDNVLRFKNLFPEDIMLAEKQMEKVFLDWVQKGDNYYGSKGDHVLLESLESCRDKLIDENYLADMDLDEALAVSKEAYDAQAIDEARDVDLDNEIE